MVATSNAVAKNEKKKKTNGKYTKQVSSGVHPFTFAPHTSVTKIRAYLSLHHYRLATEIIKALSTPLH